MRQQLLDEMIGEVLSDLGEVVSLLAESLVPGVSRDKDPVLLLLDVSLELVEAVPQLAEVGIVYFPHGFAGGADGLVAQEELVVLVLVVPPSHCSGLDLVDVVRVLLLPGLGLLIGRKLLQFE